MTVNEPIYLVHLTDIHISAPGRTPLFGLRTAEKLATVVSNIAALQLKPACIIISGDLTHDGDTEDYRYLRELLNGAEQELGIPIHVALGNHDRRKPFREGYLGEQPTDESYYYSFMVQGLRVIMLNTQVEGTHAGRLDERQLEWLKTILAEPAPRGTILVHHHPAVKTPTDLMDDHLLENPLELAEAAAGRDVIGMLSGHIHYHNVGSLNGILCAAADGVAFGLDPLAAESMRFLERSGYNLITVKDRSMIVQPIVAPGEQRVLYERSMASIPAGN